ncbi:TetR/AcrR family transcriptional regulator [Brucepastera parasyntrophica]|uniref:TetR/AcrR family transcriptional regulator n=1 Tax=Brucepastera parasyntrophica TaxID=2880008 RepID=UPI00210C15E4|nr:TetR/AcrR family transcriptional regulator [Brucepastera parasyntrophica]ULQ60465.1 TetR/AcrR family transcriptional regulator [Brucepastera parasyntrophica]
MGNTAGNRRAALTQMIIRTAFLELLKEKPAEQVTVTEICIQADINRSTFYAYYKNPDELAGSIRAEIIREVKRAVSGKHSEKKLVRKFRDVCEILKTEKDMVGILSGKSAGGNIIREITSIVYKTEASFRRNHAASGPAGNHILFNEFIIEGTAGIIRHWAGNGMKESPEKLAFFIAGLIQPVKKPA